MKAVGQHSADVFRPRSRESLPFRITQSLSGPQMEWESEVAIGLTGERKVLPMIFGGNNLLSWNQLKVPILRLMEMFRELERRCDQLEGENDRLKIDLSLAEGQVAEMQNSVASLERARNQGMKGKKNGV